MRKLVCGAMLLVLACGGGDSVGPSAPPYPDVAGIYAMTGRFDQIPESQGHFTGTLTLNQPSRQIGELNGILAIVATFDTQVISGNIAISRASTSTLGAVSFVADNLEGTTWTFTGQIGASNISSGRHTLTDGATVLSGSWEATKR